MMKNMKKFEEFAPPAELCKKIPRGEFDSSVFVWIEFANRSDYQITVRTPYIEASHKCYPAPIIIELMDQMHHCRLKHKGNVYFFERMNKPGAWAGGYNPAEIALQVWLKLKGIEHE